MAQRVFLISIWLRLFYLNSLLTESNVYCTLHFHQFLLISAAGGLNGSNSNPGDIWAFRACVCVSSWQAEADMGLNE